jgi:hypothetical protein
MKKAGPHKRHRNHTAEPSLPAVVELDDSARRPPGNLIVGIGASAGGLVAINGDFACYALADLLLTRNCPFVLTTGYGGCSLPKHLSGQKGLTKPYSTREREKHLQTLANQVALSGNSGPGSIS